MRGRENYCGRGLSFQNGCRYGGDIGKITSYCYC